MTGYDRFDAAYDAALADRADRVRPFLYRLVQPVMDRIETMDAAEMPHPWTWERHLAQVWADEGEDVARDILEDEHYAQAEEAARAAFFGEPCPSLPE